jgi:hypothetical protein
VSVDASHAACKNAFINAPTFGDKLPCVETVLAIEVVDDVYIVVVDGVVAAVILLEAFAVDEVVMNVVPRRAVVIVEALCGEW